MSAQVLQQYAVDKFSEERSGFDPATITVIFEVIMNVIKMLNECKNTPKEAAALANKPTALQKFVLTREVRKSLGLKSYREYGPEIVDAILYAGTKTTPEVMAEAFRDLG